MQVLQLVNVGVTKSPTRITTLRQPFLLFHRNLSASPHVPHLQPTLRKRGGTPPRTPAARMTKMEAILSACVFSAFANNSCGERTSELVPGCATASRSTRPALNKDILEHELGQMGVCRQVINVPAANNKAYEQSCMGQTMNTANGQAKCPARCNRYRSSVTDAFVSTTCSYLHLHQIIQLGLLDTTGPAVT